MKQKQSQPKIKRVMLSPQLKAIYYQLVTGKPSPLSREDSQLLISVLDERFPILKKEMEKMNKMNKKKGWIHWFSIGGILLALFAGWLLFGCSPVSASVETDMNAASGLQTWESDLLQFEARLTAEQQIMWAKLSDADKRIVMANNMQRAAQQAPQHPQGEKAYGYANKTLPTTQAGTQVLTDTTTSKEWFVSGEGVFRPAEKTVNTYIIQPAPVYVAPAKSDALFSIDDENMESRLLITDSANTHIVTALEKSIKQSGENFAEKLKYADASEKREFELEYFRLVKSFTLWGLLAVIPFILTSWFVINTALSANKEEP